MSHLVRRVLQLPASVRAGGAISLIVVAGFASPASAVSGEFMGFDLRLNTRLSTGVSVRMEDPSNELLFKLSVPGQSDLCAQDDCMSTTGDPAPNQRLVDAEGTFGLVNSDDGNTSYDKGDITAATTLLAPEFTLSRGNFQLTLSGMAYYDPVNDDFEEKHNDVRFRPERTPRRDEVEQQLARNAELRDAYVRTYLNAFNREFTITVGRQTIPWGESNLVLFNSLNEINPLDGAVAAFPGFEVADVLVPAGMAVTQFALNDYTTAELIYQFQWEGVRPPPSGSFLSTSDIAGGDQPYLMIGLGSVSEDPNREFMPAGDAALISSSTRTITRRPDKEPDDGGQYGVRLAYFADWLNNGTEITAHYLHYHSRFPYLDTFAADFSCIRDAAANNVVAALAACNGFNGSINPMDNGREPLPLDTAQAQLVFPEDIDMYGLSFNTNVGDWAFTGEVSYRPNLPLQIQQADLIFAALANAFPEEDLVIGAGALPLPIPVPPVIPEMTVPGERSAVPDYVTPFRGADYAPGDRIQGYERYEVYQTSFSGLRIWSNNPFAADQILLVLEAGMMHIADFTEATELPLQGPGDFTHPSPGADGTGTPDGQPDARRQNPTQQRFNLVTQNSYGWRGILRATYNEVLLEGLTLEPTFIWFHGFKGNSPSPLNNFIEGRKQITGTLNARYGRGWSAGLGYTVYTGGGTAHLEQDRDFAQAFLAYEF